jgi:DNA-binding GntR family transcriptional regulator
VGAGDVAELLAIRTELEALALAEAARTITLKFLRACASCSTRCRKLSARRIKDHGRLNREFYCTIYDAQPISTT